MAPRARISASHCRSAERFIHDSNYHCSLGTIVDRGLRPFVREARRERRVAEGGLSDRLYARRRSNAARRAKARIERRKPYIRQGTRPLREPAAGAAAVVAAGAALCPPAP